MEPYLSAPVIVKLAMPKLVEMFVKPKCKEFRWLMVLG